MALQSPTKQSPSRRSGRITKPPKKNESPRKKLSPKKAGPYVAPHLRTGDSGAALPANFTREEQTSSPSTHGVPDEDVAMGSSVSISETEAADEITQEPQPDDPRSSMDADEGSLEGLRRSSRVHGTGAVATGSRAATSSQRSSLPQARTWKRARADQSDDWRDPSIPAHKKGRHFTGLLWYVHCKRTTRKSEDFLKGDIIRVPYHIPNTAPGTEITSHELRSTCAGYVYSKLRMFVILWKHREHLFGLPLYTWHGKGLETRDITMLPEYICLKTKDDDEYKIQSLCKIKEPLEASVYENGPIPKFDKSTCVHLGGGTSIYCKADIEFVGRLDEKSYKRLKYQYGKFVGPAQELPYEDNREAPDIE